MLGTRQLVFSLMLLVFGFRPCAAARSRNAAAIETWPAPAGEKLSEDYTLRVNGRTVPVYICRVSAMPFNQIWPGYQRPLDQTEIAAFAYWGMSGPVTVEVVSNRPFQSVAVRPTSRGIHPAIEGRHITFTVAKPGQMTVELDGIHKALHLFADPPETDAPKPGDPDVLYFGPGVHKTGKIQIKSGQTVYIAGGAVVYGAIRGQGVSGVRILGRGVIDGSELARSDGGDIRFSDSSDIKIQGVIMRDPAEWCAAFFGARKVAISDVKLVGLWRYNSDGIDVCNSQDVTIRDSFIRSFDDSIVIKGLKNRRQSFDDRPVRNVRASRLVVWCDWGRALEIGAETCAPELTDVVFSDIDIIRTDVAAMDIQHGDRAAVHGIRFENIRVEIDDQNFAPIIQKSRDDKFDPVAASGFIPNLFVIIIQGTMWSHDTVRGTVRDVLYKDIFVTGKPAPQSSFTGFDAEHDVQGVRIENLRFNGRQATNLEEAHVKVGKYAGDVRLVESGSQP